MNIIYLNCGNMHYIDTTYAVVKRKPEKKKKIRPVRDSNPMTSAIPVLELY